MRGENILRAGAHILCFVFSLKRPVASLASLSPSMYPITFHSSDQIKLRKYKNCKSRLMVSGKEKVPMPQ